MVVIVLKSTLKERESMVIKRVGCKEKDVTQWLRQKINVIVTSSSPGATVIHDPRNS
jgi:hypothetical protein